MDNNTIDSYVTNEVFNNLKTFTNLLDKISLISLAMNNAINSSCNEDVLKIALELDVETEKLVNLARLIPVYTGVSNAMNLVEKNILNVNDIKIEYIENNWFHIVFPTLLPKKNKGNASYIRTTLQVAIKHFFESNQRIIPSKKCTVIFKHNYTKNYELKKYRDHDNYEIKATLDIIALYLLKDDNPNFCEHFYMSDISDKVNTEIFVIPSFDFPKWLSIYKKE